ncbi:MAG: P-II family nitrogen regulator [Bacillota bacterium]|nr:P-II family nitrogen regulator [Bacillota bacterium]
MNDIRYMLNVFIVDYGKASKILKFIKSRGIGGGTILHGRGINPSNWLKFLELSEVKKELVLSITRADQSAELLSETSDQFEFHKRNKGICFSMPLRAILGSNSIDKSTPQSQREEPMNNHLEYKALYVIVDKGQAETVIDTATAIGAKGGTILNARGSGIHERQKFFGIEIEPEKEMVLMLIETPYVENIAKTIYDKLDMEKPGNGMMFVQDVERTYGLYRGESSDASSNR